jgi:hypothetical protein
MFTAPFDRLEIGVKMPVPGFEFQTVGPSTEARMAFLTLVEDTLPVVLFMAILYRHWCSIVTIIQCLMPTNLQGQNYTSFR